MTPTEYFTETEEDEVFSDGFKKGYESGFSDGVDRTKDCLRVIVQSLPFLSIASDQEIATYIINCLEVAI